MTIHAFTELHNNFPAFINLSEQPDGSVKVSVRTRGNDGKEYASICLTTLQAEELADSIYKHNYKGEYEIDRQAPAGNSSAAPSDEPVEISEALADFLAEHTRLNQDGIDSHAMKMTLALNYAALNPTPEADIAEWREQGYLDALAAPAPTGESLSVPHEMGYRSGGNHIATAYANGWNDCRATMLGEIPDDPSSDPAAKEST